MIGNKHVNLYVCLEILKHGWKTFVVEFWDVEM